MRSLCLSFSMQALGISSSWMWESAVKPWHILPFAFAAVCLAEFLVLGYMGGVSKWRRLLSTVLGSNAVCFLLPCAFRWFGLFPLYGLSFDGVSAAFECGPFYTVTTVLIVADVLKLLLLLFLFRKEPLHRGSRALVLMAANAVIFGLTACIERLLCSGFYI